MSIYENAVLRISHTETSTRLLGPFDRFVIWVHGCCFDCEDCLAQNTRFGAYEEISVRHLAREIVDSGCEGVTVSGGEPFLQAAALTELVCAVRRERDIGVIVYSGFTLEELQEKTECQPLLEKTDLLIDGRYVKELDDGRAYIGSSNQQLHYLTDRYKTAGERYYARDKKRVAEIKITPTRAVLIGVPSAKVLSVWQALKEKGAGGGSLKNDV